MTIAVRYGKYGASVSGGKDNTQVAINPIKIATTRMISDFTREAKAAHHAKPSRNQLANQLTTANAPAPANHFKTSLTSDTVYPPLTKKKRDDLK